MKAIEHIKSNSEDFNPFQDLPEHKPACSEIDFLVKLIVKDPKVLFDLESTDLMNTELHIKLIKKMGLQYPFLIIQPHFFDSQEFVKECFSILEHDPHTLINVVIKSCLRNHEVNKRLEGKDYETCINIIKLHFLAGQLEIKLPNKQSVTKRHKI